MKLRLSTFIIFIAISFLVDGLCALLSMMWAVPEPLTSNSVFWVSLALTHLFLGMGLSWGNELMLSILVGLFSSALGYIAFSISVFDLNFILRSEFPLFCLLLGSATGSFISSIFSRIFLGIRGGSPQEAP